ncbi:MAG TPA: RcnB family protein [Croceibacterium sp.]|nr:RcnB family protein [Croceibacterium sp.]
MKKVLLSLAAAATAFAIPVSASAADYHNHDRGNRYEQRYDHGQKHQSNRYDNQRYRQFAKGQRFDSRYARNYRAINNPRAYNLREAPRGQHWVQSGNDALLVGLVGGVIGAVIGNAL